MATKQEKELTVEERLKLVYQLQTILYENDRIKTLRGELPLEVQDLEDEIAGLETRLNNYGSEVTELKKSIDGYHAAIDESSKLIDKYTHDQDNVRNNREYDYLTKEIEYQQLNIDLADKRIREASQKIENVNRDIEEVKTQLEDSNHVLGEKKGEGKIDPRLLTAFKRIRKNAHNGLGVVYVQRYSCGGCFNRIPDQRRMEIKMHKKIIVCEYCGRILIDPEIAGLTDVEAKNVEPTKTKETKSKAKK